MVMIEIFDIEQVGGRGHSKLILYPSGYGNLSLLML